MKQKLEPQNHDKNGAVIKKIVKGRYHGDLNPNYHKVMQVLEVDKNGVVLKKIARNYAEVKMEQEEEKKKKKEEGSDSELEEEDWEPRWSDVNLAMHLWRGVCRSKGVKMHDYVLRKDYRNMTREEIHLDLLWRKVYKAEAEEDAEDAAADAEEDAAEEDAALAEAAAIASI